MSFLLELEAALGKLRACFEVGDLQERILKIELIAWAGSLLIRSEMVTRIFRTAELTGIVWPMFEVEGSNTRQLLRSVSDGRQVIGEQSIAQAQDPNINQRHSMRNVVYLLDPRPQAGKENIMLLRPHCGMLSCSFVKSASNKL